MTKSGLAFTASSDCNRNAVTLSSRGRKAAHFLYSIYSSSVVLHYIVLCVSVHVAKEFYIFIHYFISMDSSSEIISEQQHLEKP